ncbi:MAG: hypothetical protein CME70_00270 [Halobacteriovorax sp.]|nr:hypothetical protein [Halobacteriovorax sp.]
MSENKTLNNASINWHILNWVAIIGMISTSIYLTSHYFDVHFPTGLVGGSLCDLNSFFTCSTATNSPLSNIAGVPISLFGLLVGVFLAFGYLFKNDETEGTNHFVLLINMIGCLVLFAYSLIGLGTLCPFCTLYYIFSGIALFVFYKHSSLKTPSVKIISGYLVVSLIVGGITWNNINEKNSKKNQLAKSLIDQFYKLPNLGKPKTDSPFLVAKATENFSDAPIRITKFSDFECPACGMLSEHLLQVAKKYKGKVSIQYKFYPLDTACNGALKRQIHPYACMASYLAFCAPEKFESLHHEIFKQVSASEGLSNKWLDDKAKALGVTECYKAKETKEAVVEIINEAKPFNIASTPSMLINGVKIEGVLPLKQIYIILDEILRRAK